MSYSIITKPSTNVNVYKGEIIFQKWMELSVGDIYYILPFKLTQYTKPVISNPFYRVY